jgi:hypothetical protein
VVITRRESFKVVVRLNRRRVLRLGVPHRSGILGQPALHDIISDIPPQEESLVREHGVSSECRSLKQVEKRTCMERLLSVMYPQFCILSSDTGQKGGAEFEFNASGNLIIQFDFGVECVGGGPTLSQGDAPISVLPLEFAGNAAYGSVRTVRP